MDRGANRHSGYGPSSCDAVSDHSPRASAELSGCRSSVLNHVLAGLKFQCFGSRIFTDGSPDQVAGVSPSMASGSRAWRSRVSEPFPVDGEGSVPTSSVPVLLPWIRSRICALAWRPADPFLCVA